MRSAILSMVLAGGATGFSQTPAAPAAIDIAFDVASLKPARPTPPFPVVLGFTRNGTTTLTDVTLVQALMFAFGINGSNRILSPSVLWARDGSELFSIEGKAPPDTPRDVVRQMTLNLLTDRFKLKFHHEQRDIPYYALVVDKKGSKLKEAAAGGDKSGMRARAGLIEVQGASIDVFIQTMQFLRATGSNRPILNLTELKGRYDMKLEWTPKSQVQTDPDALAGLDFSDALPEQLGLRMDLRTGPMDVIVVDAADRTPEAN